MKCNYCDCDVDPNVCECGLGIFEHDDENHFFHMAGCQCPDAKPSDMTIVWIGIVCFVLTMALYYVKGWL